MPKELTDLTIQLIHTTTDNDGEPKAYLVNDGTTQVWLPAAACELDKNKDGTYTLTLPVKLAAEKRLI